MRWEVGWEGGNVWITILGLEDMRRLWSISFMVSFWYSDQTPSLEEWGEEPGAGVRSYSRALLSLWIEAQGSDLKASAYVLHTKSWDIWIRSTWDASKVRRPYGWPLEELGGTAWWVCGCAADSTGSVNISNDAEFHILGKASHHFS